jgi:hypothetical protein
VGNGTTNDVSATKDNALSNISPMADNVTGHQKYLDRSSYVKDKSWEYCTRIIDRLYQQQGFGIDDPK